MSTADETVTSLEQSVEQTENGTHDKEIQEQLKTDNANQPENESATTAVDVSMTSSDEKGGNQKSRKPRVKGLLQKLQDQVEFYFGDSNLFKDRFLKQKIAEHPDGYVAVDVIASFNKMKAFTPDLNLITQAIQNSTLLELSSDHKWVRRSLPLPTLSEFDIDSRTIYVENLPANTNHDKLRKLFKSFGTVTYISLPRHKISNAIKGFAFIEYSSAEEAQRAVEFFKQEETNKVENESHVNEQDSAVQKELVATPMEDSVFFDANKEKLIITESTNRELAPISNADAGQVQSIESTPSLKRTRESDDEPKKEIAADEPESKRIKSEEPVLDKEIESSIDTTSEKQLPQSEAVPTRKRTRWNSEDFDVDKSKEGKDSGQVSRLDSTWSEFSALEDEEGEEDVEGEKKKKRVRKHRRRRESVAQHLKDLNLRVLSKEKWLEMKKLFKQMQKDQMKILKGDNKKDKNKKPQTTKGFVANCLVKVICSEEKAVTPDMLKEVCSKYGPVAFVDFTETAKEGYVRYGESGCVDKLMGSSVVLEGVIFESVTEEDERGYFLKTQASRRQQFMNKKRKSTRGQDKVISKALKRIQEQTHPPTHPSHIRFSDSDKED